MKISRIPYLIALIATLFGGSVWATDDDTKTSDPRQPKKPKIGESPIYIKLYGFYGLLTPGSRGAIQSAAGPSTNTTFKVGTYGLGAGPRMGIGVGFIVSEFVNVGLDVDYLFGKPLVSTSTGTTSRSENSTEYEVVTISPNVMFKAVSQPSYYIYNRIGLCAGVLLNHTSTYHYESGTPLAKYDYKYELESGLGIGYQAALGIQFRIAGALRGFAELNAISLTFRPTRQEQTVNNKNGVNAGKLSITEYKSQGTYSNTETTKNYINTSATYALPINSVGIGAGLVFRL